MSYGTSEYRYEQIVEELRIPEGWSFFGATGVSVDSQDRVHLYTRSGHPVLVFDHEGRLLTSWKEGPLFRGGNSRAHGLCVGPDGAVYCVDDGSHIVSKFSPEGQLLMVLGNRDQPSDTGYVREQGAPSIKRSGPPFNRPTGVALSPSGAIYVSDGYGNARIHKFAPDGTLLFSWGQPGAAPGEFNTPHGIWVDKRGRVWVAERGNNRVQIFNAQGEFLSQWTGLSDPTDICIGRDDEIAYVSQMTHGVSMFTMDGQLLACWGREGFDNQTVKFHTIAVDSRGDLYAGGSKGVFKFARRA